VFHATVAQTVWAQLILTRRLCCLCSEQQSVLKNKRTTWCHLILYFTSYVLNMFRTLICSSSVACNYSVELPRYSYCSWFDVCWGFGVVGLEWYPCCRLKQNSWYFISLLICSTCFEHKYIHHQEPATILLNYHIGRIVLVSMCVGVSVWLFWSGIRVAGWSTTLDILFHFLYAQHVSNINISIIRSLRLFCWITTLVVLFLVRSVLEFRCGWFGVASVLQAEAELLLYYFASYMLNMFRT